jgi:glycosyltransferase involved in cell wall biosynthesis
MEKRKRILYLITKANWGGAQRYCYDLALAARAAGHEVAVAYGEPGLLASKLASENIRTIHIRSLARDIKSSRDWHAFRELRRLMRAERPDILHLNSSKAAGLGAVAARLSGIPHIIFTAHGWAWNESRPLYQRLAIRSLAWATVLLSHTTICVSRATKHDARWMSLVESKMVVIHNGFTCVPLISRAEARAALLPGEAGKRWIGMLSELHPTKRIEDAIDAFALIASDHLDTILLVCGEGERRTALEARIAERGLADRIFLLGFVADAPRYLAAFDLFLHTSQSDTLAYAILEAGCARLPVVATEVGGIPEIIESGVSGLLVPPRAPSKAAQALRQLLEDSAHAEQLGEHLRARIIRDFALERMLRETLALYAKN